MLSRTKASPTRRVVPESVRKIGTFANETVRPEAAKLARKAAGRLPDMPERVRVGPLVVMRARDVGRTPRSEKRRIAAAAAAAAFLAYLFDPAMGRTRRAQMSQRAMGMARRTGRRAQRLGRATTAEAHAITQKIKHLREEPKERDDATLVQKVRSEVLGREEHRSKAHISIDAAGGIVTLRGTCEDPGAMRALERSVRRTNGVRDVVNLLHPVGAPAPNKEGALHAGR